MGDCAVLVVGCWKTRLAQRMFDFTEKKNSGDYDNKCTLGTNVKLITINYRISCIKHIVPSSYTVGTYTVRFH